VRRVVVVHGKSDAGVADQVSGAGAGVAAGQPGGTNIRSAPRRKIDGVDGGALAIGLRQGHRLLTDWDGQATN
jgi:hypothetical protein